MPVWDDIARGVIRGKKLNRIQARAVLRCPDSEVPALVASAYQVRRHYFANKVRLNYLINVKSGICPEDCAYCSQSRISRAHIHKYPLLPKNKIVELSGRGVALGARRVCLVASGRKTSRRELEQVSEAVKEVKLKYPETEICCCLGLIGKEEADSLKAKGVTAYNHNLNTSSRFYRTVCTTHTYKDRIRTVNVVKASELSPCVGCLFGMGETESDILDLAFAVSELNPDSVPVNFLMPVTGTPLGLKTSNGLTPLKCLKILSLFRFMLPDKEIRIAGGRELHLGWLQPMGLYPANSIFIGDYLTTKGQPPESDLKMITDLGFVCS